MSGLNILLVDDERDLLMNLEAALKAEGHTVILAESGTEAVEGSVTHRPDLIILDVMMPGVDGFEACRRIKNNPLTENIGVIFLTARDVSTSMVEGLDLGAMDYITKPFRYEELFARIRSFQRILDYQRKLTTMVEFSSGVNILDLEMLVKALESGLPAAFRVELFSIFLLDEQKHLLRLAASNHPHFKAAEGLELRLESTPLMHDAVRSGNPVYVSDFSKSRYAHRRRDEGDQRGKYSDDYAISIPLVMGERILGVLNLNGNRHGFFDRPDFTFIKLGAEHVASAFSNALQYKKIQEMAVSDALTGLFNRRYFHDRLTLEWERTRRYGSKLSLIMADIDFFKKINDTYGHLCGDMVLVQTAEVLRLHLRRTDVVARYGGEEFVMLLPETSLESARLVAERIRADMESRRFPWESKTVKATLSIGIDEASESGVKDRTDLVRRADEKLYKAKEAGRNRVIG